MRMSRFMDAPTEVILLVASHLATADKTSLLRVCKALHQIVEPTLFYEISMSWHGYAEPTPRLDLLLSRVIACPQLADAVRRVKFTGTKLSPLWNNASTPKFCDDNMQQLIDLVKPSGLTTSYRTRTWNAKGRSIGEQEVWERHIVEGEVDLYQALIISRLSNITYLGIGFDDRAGYEYISATLHHALCSNEDLSNYSKFLRLKRVDLYADIFYREIGDIFATCEGFDTDVGDVLPFFYLPSLQEFRVAMPEYGIKLAWPTFPPCADALKILRLQRSHVKVNAIEQLLVVTPNLEILEYDYCCEVGHDYRWGPSQYLKGAALGKALAPLRTTLRILRVSVHFYFCTGRYYEDPTPNYGIEGVLGSLKDFRHLIEVEVPFALLLGSNVWSNSVESLELPPNLQFLVLRDDMASYHHYPWRSEQCLKALPRLNLLWPMQESQIRSLGLNINECLDDWDENTLAAFQTLCQVMHIGPKVHKKAWDCSYPGTPVFDTGRFK